MPPRVASGKARGPASRDRLEKRSPSGSGEGLRGPDKKAANSRRSQAFVNIGARHSAIQAQSGDRAGAVDTYVEPAAATGRILTYQSGGGP